MKLIAIEEHFLTSEIRAAWAASAIGHWDPYQYRPGAPARAFLNQTALSPDQKSLFAHANWDRLTQ